MSELGFFSAGLLSLQITPNLLVCSVSFGYVWRSFSSMCGGFKVKGYANAGWRLD